MHPDCGVRYDEYGHHYDVFRSALFHTDTPLGATISQSPALVGPRDVTRDGFPTTLFQLLRNGLYAYPLPELNLAFRQALHAGILRVAVAEELVVISGYGADQLSA